MDRLLARLFLILLLSLPSLGQGVLQGGQWYGGLFGGNGIVPPPPTGAPQLPTTWVDGNESTCGWLAGYAACSTLPPSPGLMLAPPTYTLTLNSLGGAWTFTSNGSPTTAPCSLGTSRYHNTMAGRQNAYADLENCRRTANFGFLIVTPVASADNNSLCTTLTTYCGTSGLSVPQSNSQMATTSIVEISDHHAALLALGGGKVIGAGGIQDNISESTAPGLANDDATGSNMYYEYGPTNSNGGSANSCNVADVICGIVQVSTSTKALASVTVTGTPVLLPLQNGYVSPATVPSTVGSNSGCASGQYFVNDPGHTECVTPVYGPNETGLYASFAKLHTINPASPYLISYTPDDGGGSGSFQLNNGTFLNTSAYNYVADMLRTECTATGCIPIALCSPTANSPGVSCTGGTSSACPTGCGPDHWELDDNALAFCPGGGGFNISNCPGATNNNYSFTTGGVPTQIQNFSEYASHIHVNHSWAHGDWTCLQCGTNAMAYGFDFSGCQYCSLENSFVSEALRPGGEGHDLNLQTQQMKVTNVVMRGSAIGFWMGGGESNGPAIAGGNVSNIDSEFRRTVSTFPYSWLGFQCINGVPGGVTNANNNNGCGNLPDLDFYWGGAGEAWLASTAAISTIAVTGTGPFTVTVTTATPFNPGVGPNVVTISHSTCTGGGCTSFNGTFNTLTTSSSGFTFSVVSYTGTINNVGNVQVNAPGCGGSDLNVTCVNVDTTGTLVTHVSGPWFHDPNSIWGQAHQIVNVNNDGTTYHIGNVGVPITAASSTGSPSWTVTITSTLNPGVTVPVAVGGLTPGACDGVFTTLSSSSSQFTYTATGCTSTPTLTNAAASNLCNSWPLSTNCPTTLVLQSSTPVSECVSSGCTNVPFQTRITNSMVRKNGQEMKEGVRVLVAGAICENVDNSGGQNGICFSDAIRSTSGGAGESYYVTEHDITVQGLITRNNCDGSDNAGGRSSNLSSGNGVSYQQVGLAFTNTIAYSLTNTNPGCGTDSYGVEVDNGSQRWNVIPTQTTSSTVRLVGFASVDSGVQVISATVPATCPSPFGAFNCTTYTTTGSTAVANQILCGGATGGAFIYVYGFVNSTNNAPAPAGLECAASTASTLVMVNSATSVAETLATNCLINGLQLCKPGSAIPLYNNANPIVAATAISNAATIGYQVFDAVLNDNVFVTGCADSKFNMPVYLVGNFQVSSGMGPSVTTGSTNWVNGTTLNPASNWVAGMLTLSYPWSNGASVNETDTSGNCVFSNVQGGPVNVTWNHTTLITDSTSSILPLNVPGGTGLNYQSGTAMLNSIYTTGSLAQGVANGGWYNGNSALPHEGTNTEIINYDVTTMSTWGLVWASSYGNVPRTASLYTEFPNNPFFTESGFASICAGIFTLPNSLTTTGCTLSSMSSLNFHFPAGACAIGFNITCTGSGVTAQLPLTTPDYHQYALTSGSIYHNASPDGSGDIGAIISGPTYSIDSLQTSTQYVCATPCGTGPFPD